MNTSRRALLVAPLAPSVTLCDAPSLAAPAGVSPALTQLIAAYAAADAEYDRFCDEVHNPDRLDDMDGDPDLEPDADDEDTHDQEKTDD